MSNINELSQRIATLNAECQKLNNQRALNLGKRDALSKQLEVAIANYNEKYGKNLTLDTLDAEISAVLSVKEKEIENISAVLSAIKTGDFDTANRLAGVVTEPTMAVSMPTANPEPATVNLEPAMANPEPAMAVSTPTANPEPAMVNPEPTLAVPTPMANPEPTLAMPTPMSVPSNSAEEPATPIGEALGISIPTPPPVVPITPPPIAQPTPTPVAPSAPKSFSAILGGTVFGQ